MSFKILLVDHDTAAVERMSETVRKAGHQLFTEIDTARVLKSLDSIRPDVALVADGVPGMPGAALCMRLKKTRRGPSTPVVFMTTQVPKGEKDLSRRLELLGCDRIIDRQTSSEQLLEICRQLAGGPEQDLPAEAPPRAQATTQELPQANKATNRDAPSAAAFDDAVRSPFTDASRTADGGLDIEAHLDSVFSVGLPGDGPAPILGSGAPAAEPATPKAATPPVPPSPQPAAPRKAPVSRPAAPAPKPVQTSQAPVTGSGSARPAAPTRPPTEQTARAAQPVPVPAQPSPPPQPTPSRPAVDPKPAERPQRVARQAPKAVEQLRLPRVPEVPSTAGRSTRRWVGPVVGLVAIAVVLGSLAVVYLVFLGRDAGGESAEVAQASVSVPTPSPALPEPAETEPLPEPPPLEDSPVASDPTKVAVTIPKPKPSEKATTPRGNAETEREEPAVIAESRRRSEPEDPSAIEKARPSPEKTTRAPVVAANAGQAAAETPTRDPEPSGSRPTQPKPEPEVAAGTQEGSASDAPSVAALPAEDPTRSPETTTAVPPKPVAAEPLVLPPEVLKRVEPQYSAKAVKDLDNPVIALRVLVDRQGKIARVLVDEGIPGSELEGAAISAVLRWRFRPATEDGVPVKAWTTVRFVFED